MRSDSKGLKRGYSKRGTITSITKKMRRQPQISIDTVLPLVHAIIISFTPRKFVIKQFNMS